MSFIHRIGKLAMRQDHLEVAPARAGLRRLPAQLYSIAALFFLLALAVSATLGLRIAIWSTAFH